MAQAPASKTAPTQEPVAKHSNFAAVLTAGLAVFLVLTLSLGTWAKNNLFNTRTFSNHIVTSVQSEPVRNAIASEISSTIYANYPLAERVLRGPTESFISSQLASERAGNLLSSVATNLQNRAIHGNDQPIVVDISGLTQTLAAMRATLAPDSEPRFTLPQGEAARIVILQGDEVPNLKTAGMIILGVAPFATAGLIVLAIIAWFRVRSKARFFVISGIVLVSSGALLLIFTDTAASQLSLVAQNASQATILESIYNEFITNLRTWQTTLMVCGILTLIATWGFQKRHTIIALSKQLRVATAKQ